MREISDYQVDDLSDIGYEESIVDVIRYLGSTMCVIRNVKVYVKIDCDEDDELIDMFIPEESKEYIKKELDKYNMEEMV